MTQSNKTHADAVRIDDSPCKSLSGRRREICEGTADIPEEERQRYLKNWRRSGVIPRATAARRANAQPANVDHGESSPRAPEGRTTYDPATPCRHLGEVLRIEQCRLCGGKSRPAEVRACAVKGECTLNEFKLRLPICFKCREYEP